MRNVPKSIEGRLVLPGTRGRREWGETASGYRVSFWSDKNVLELDSGDGCTAL